MTTDEVILRRQKAAENGEPFTEPPPRLRGQSTYLALAVANGMLYAVGGGKKSKTIERYDHETNKWTMIYSSHQIINGYLCTTFNDEIITQNNIYRFEVYNTTTNEWKVNTSITELKDPYHIFSFWGPILESNFIEN